MKYRLFLYTLTLLLLSTIVMSSCAGTPSAPSASTVEHCTSFANSEVERIVPTKPHELRCSGNESEEAYIQHKIWSFDKAYAACMGTR